MFENVSGEPVGVGGVGGEILYTGSVTMLAGTTSVDVLHGIGAAPDINKIGITPKDNLGGRTFWVEVHPSDPATYFVLKMSSLDTSNHVFAWRY